MVWSLFSRNDNSNNEFISGLSRLVRKATIDSFKYTKDLEKNLADFSNHSHTEFREYCDDDDTCVICLHKLVGHCSKLACDCGLVIHESCKFKLMLGGFIKCPQCDLTLSSHKYKTTIQYPVTLDPSVILEQYKKVNNNNTSANAALAIIEKKTIKDTGVLRRIYQ